MELELVHINGTWINPKYVTAVTDLGEDYPRYRTKVTVVGNAGYGTFEVFSVFPAAEIVADRQEKENKATPEVMLLMQDGTKVQAKLLL